MCSHFPGLSELVLEKKVTNTLQSNLGDLCRDTSRDPSPSIGYEAAIAQGNSLLSPKAQSGSSADWGRKVQFHQNQDFLQPFDVSDPLLTLKPKPALKEYMGDRSNFS